jgi:hypothetical protein
MVTLSPRTGAPTSQKRNRTRRVATALGIVAGVVGVLAGAAVLTGLGLARPEGERLTPAGMPRNTSYYVTMPDGVDLAVDVWLPADHDAGRTVPTILESTRYGRAIEPTWFGRSLQGLGVLPDFTYDDIIDTFTSNGYAYAVADMRGSGASFGTRTVEYSAEEVADLDTLISWLAAQEWSDGSVGTFGISYTGSTAELAAASGNPALRAAAPTFSDWDVTSTIASPGGVQLIGFLEEWGTTNNALDRNDVCGAFGAEGPACLAYRSLTSGIAPVDGHEYRLSEAIADHAENWDLVEAVPDMQFRDSDINGRGTTLDDISPYAYEDGIEAAAVPMHVQVGWFDAYTSKGALDRYRSFDVPQVLEIGAWSHGALYDTDPFADPEAPAQPNLPQLVAFFDAHLKGEEQSVTGKTIRYWTMNGGGWSETDTWPPAGTTTLTLHLGEGGSLTEEAAVEVSRDAREVDLQHSTGPENRWWTQMTSGDIVIGDRAAAAETLHTYTSEPNPDTVQITGTPVVRLTVSTEQDAAALHVYLEDVAPDGRVTYLSEGTLNLRDRATSTSGPYDVTQPFHSQRAADALPVVPGEPMTVDVALSPVSVRLDPGHPDPGVRRRRGRLRLRHGDGTGRADPAPGRTRPGTPRPAGDAVVVTVSLAPGTAGRRAVRPRDRPVAGPLRSLGRTMATLEPCAQPSTRQGAWSFRGSCVTASVCGQVRSRSRSSVTGCSSASSPVRISWRTTVC